MKEPRDNADRSGSSARVLRLITHLPHLIFPMRYKGDEAMPAHHSDVASSVA